MSYTPINADIYTAAFSGAVAGIQASGKWVTDTNSADYVNQAQICGAVAAAIDTVWNNAGVPNSYQVLGIMSIVQATFTQRSPDMVAANYLQATWTPLANAIVAQVTGGTSYLTAQGITPPQWPGGSSGNLPAPPTTDGNYVLVISGGSPSWGLTGFAPAIALASGGSGPFILGGVWTPTFNLSPAANSVGITAASLIDSLANNANVLGQANPLAAPSGTHNYQLNAAGSVTVHGSMTKAGTTASTGNITASWASHTYSGIGAAGGTQAVINGINQDIKNGGGILLATLAATAGAIVNPSGQSFGPYTPANQKIYDLIPHTANGYSYKDQNGFGVPMTRTTINVTNENAVVASFDLYESDNLLNATFTLTRTAL